MKGGKKSLAVRKQSWLGCAASSGAAGVRNTLGRTSWLTATKCQELSEKRAEMLTIQIIRPAYTKTIVIAEIPNDDLIVYRPCFYGGKQARARAREVLLEIPQGSRLRLRY